MKSKLVRITTIPISLEKLLENQLRFMDQYFEVIAVSSDRKGLEKVGSKEGVRTFCVELTRKITPLADLRALVQLYRFLKKEKPLIVHTHTPKAGTIGMIAAKLAGIKHRFHTVAGLPLLEARGVKRLLLDLVEKITYACASAVYPNSLGLKKIIIEKKLSSEKILKVIGDGSSNGIDTELFKRCPDLDEKAKALKDSLGLSDIDFVFIFIGRLVRDKGIEELVRAFAKLSNTNPNAKLLLVGSEERDLDPLSQECLNEISSNKSILTVGYQSDVRPYLSLSKALVFPSYREGFPNVPMQAGCFDLPSIVTDINGCNEIVINNINGIVIQVKNSDAIYAAMEKLLLNENFYQLMASKARNMIVDRYEQTRLWSLLLKEYDEQLKSCYVL
ncbi:glycosyltransferase family 4 protein [Pedobacter ginsengisoli]|uniref:glycosyltransferase family 4 protein n=1 Tax=Pedobacter ginsengisoli TaxID=363852 RepID=UPI002551C6D5|nr:glycosyltransferase family 4 protein [Pedobacter ginsengisoli]